MEEEKFVRAIILEILDNAIYKVEDIENKAVIEMKIQGKARMNYISFSVGDEVTLVVSSSDPESGRFMPEKYWHMALEQKWRNERKG